MPREAGCRERLTCRRVLSRGRQTAPSIQETYPRWVCFAMARSVPSKTALLERREERSLVSEGKA
ncbi:MAG: hypothetical protein U9Q71_05275, partial [Pseudomonadota bacterium]|nr:hypothetical protein [Pseudomonadota bacterium]